MSNSGRFGKRGDAKRKQRREMKGEPMKSVPPRGREIFKREEHFKIAPKHPRMGRK